MNENIDDELIRLSRCICANADVIEIQTTTSSTEAEKPDGAQNRTLDYCATSYGDVTSNDPLRDVEALLHTRVIVVICIFGVIGNAGNLLVLVPQGRHGGTMGRIERSVHWGLVSLAVSDLFFCLTVIPKAFTDRDPFVLRPNFSLFYSVYGDGLIGVFVMASTWLTVVMAVGRYLAICHPFRARQMIGTTLTKRTVLLVYAACAVCNAPRFLIYRVQRIDCSMAEFYFRWPGVVNVKRNRTLEAFYMWLYFVVCVWAPCVLLSISNAFLIRALRRARTALPPLNRSRRADVDPPDPEYDQYRPITVTLVALIVMYIVLVSPAEIVIFMRHRVGGRDVTYHDTYDLVAAVGNTLQALNFSVNFVIYYVINVRFRRALLKLFTRRCRRNFSSASQSVTGSVSLNNIRRRDRDRPFLEKLVVLPVNSKAEVVLVPDQVLQ